MKTIGANNQQGAAYAFKRTNTTWAQQAQLVAAGGGAHDRLGGAVALSTDGNTALAGAEGHMVGSNIGAAFVFTRSVSTWSQQAMLPAPEGVGSFWGNSIALSPNGSTALIDDGYTFHRSGSTWAPGMRLQPSDGGSGFGASGALSADGSIVLIGAKYANIAGHEGQGAAYFFTHTQDSIIPIYLPLIRR